MKKFLIVAVLAVIFVMTMCVAVACENGSNTGFSVTASQSSVIEGKNTTVTAQTNSEEAIAWSVSDETVLSIKTSLGKICVVTGLKPGKANVIATQGEEVAKCEITVTSLADQPRVEISCNGSVVSEKLSVEMEKTLQLTAEALNTTENVAKWSSSDESKATVKDGLVTGKLPGTVTITASVNSTLFATVEVEITMKQDSVYYDLKYGEEKGANAYNAETEKFDGEELAEDEFYQWHSQSAWGMQQVNLEYAYYLNGEIHIKYTSDWDPGYWNGMQIFHKSSTQTKGSYYQLSCTINVNEACDITLNGTKISLNKGSNNVVVYYQLTAMMYEEGISSFDLALGCIDGSKTGSFLKNGEVTVSNIAWQEISERTTLVAPSFTITDGVISITDTNQTGVGGYLMTFFKEGKAVGTVEVFNGKEVDMSGIDKGTYTVKLQATAADIRFVKSGYSDSTAEITVTTAASYTLADSSAGGAVASPGKWTYWASGWVEITEKTFADGALTFSFSNNTGNWYDTQLFYKSTTNIAGKHYTATFDLELNEGAGGHVTICGTEVELTAGKHTYSVVTLESENDASLTILFGLNGQDKKQEIPQGTVVISNLTFQETEAQKLVAPSFAISEENVITITDTNQTGVGHYELGFFAEADSPVYIVKVQNGTAVDMTTVKKGTYTVRIRAQGENAMFSTSDWSEGSATLVSTTENTEENIAFGENGAGKIAVTSPDRWYYWNDQGWQGSNVSVSQAKIIGNSIVVTYSSTGACNFGLQLFYDYSANTVGAKYKLTLTVKSTIANTITINGQQVTLEANVEKAVEIVFAEPSEGTYDGATISIQVPVNNNGGTITLTDVTVVANNG